jgi:hypothetical protein
LALLSVEISFILALFSRRASRGANAAIDRRREGGSTGREGGAFAKRRRKGKAARHLGFWGEIGDFLSFWAIARLYINKDENERADGERSNGATKEE